MLLPEDRGGFRAWSRGVRLDKGTVAAGFPPVTGPAGCQVASLQAFCFVRILFQMLESILNGNNLTSFRFVFNTHVFQQKMLKCYVFYGNILTSSVLSSFRIQT